MSHTTPIEAAHVKKGSFVLLCGHPCQIAKVKISKTGKHGHAKCNIVGISVLDSKKYNEVRPGHVLMRAFELDKKEYELTDIDEKEGFFTMMEIDDKTATQHTFAIETDNLLHREIIAAFGTSKIIQIVVVTAPQGEEEEKTTLVSVLESWKYESD